jgi:hypothetical protein
MEATYFFDPACPFTWRTSRWLLSVAPGREVSVRWRAFSLGILNGDILVLLAERPAEAQRDSAILRGRGLELVDADGRVRGQFTVEASGEAVFRLRDSAGTIRVKLSAGAGGSGLLLLDETTEPAVQMIARRAASSTQPATTSINLTGASGQRRTITP